MTVETVDIPRNYKEFFTQSQGVTEAKLAQIAATAIGYADVQINVHVDEEITYPSYYAASIFIKHRPEDKRLVAATFSYHREAGSPGKIHRPRLKQHWQKDGAYFSIDDWLLRDPTGIMVLRKRETLSTDANGKRTWSKSLKPATPDTIIAMAALAAYHATASARNK